MDNHNKYYNLKKAGTDFNITWKVKVLIYKELKSY